MIKFKAAKCAPIIGVGVGIGIAYLLGYSRGGAQGLDMGIDLILDAFDRSSEKGALEIAFPEGMTEEDFVAACFDEKYKEMIINKYAVTRPIQTILIASGLKKK